MHALLLSVRDKVLTRDATPPIVPAVFLQPGTFDDEVLKFARDGEGEDAAAQADGAGFKAVVAGFGGGTVGSEGWCVLVDGERGLKTAGKL